MTLVPHRHGKAYAETSRCPGGALCLDFCNTGQGARDRGGAEWLAGFDDLLNWFDASAALKPEYVRRFRHAADHAPDYASKFRLRAIALRETLHRVFEARVRGEVPSRADLARLETEYAQGAAFAQLAWEHGRGTWKLDPAVTELAAMLQPVMRSAADLLTSDALARLRRCGNPTCSWLFIDETRNRSRRWCEMASCGNVLKVRRHRERTRKITANGRRAARAVRKT